MAPEGLPPGPLPCVLSLFVIISRRGGRSVYASVLIHLRACRDGRINHQKMEFFLHGTAIGAVAFLVNGTDQHAAGIDAHHGSRRKVGDRDAGLSNQLFRLIVSVNTA